jgi:pSer/pThr/pTyr-binding forkhead associated (FHA) protein
MFVLEVTSGPGAGQAIEVLHGKRLRIGRAADANIGFDDPQLSAEHAAFTWTDDGFAIDDLDSLNGTFVNGERVQGRRGLRLGDFIQVGGLILRLREVPADFQARRPQLEAPGGVPKVFAAKTMMVPRRVLMGEDSGVGIPTTGPRALSAGEPRPRSLVPTVPPPGGGMLALRGAQRTQMAQVEARAVLDAASLEVAAELARVINGPAGRGARIIIRLGERLDPFRTLPVLAGREKSNPLILDDDAVSLKHLAFDHRDGAYVVRDLGSSNGTFVNGQRVVQRRLEQGDVITVGRYTLLVVLGETCLGVAVFAPGVATDAPVSDASEGPRLGVVRTPLGKKAKKKKKRASELVWFATSDLDRGVYRARSAVLALLGALLVTAWLLDEGASEVLAGGALAAAHESETFRRAAAERDQHSCTACHVGGGQVSTLKCLDCHAESRPRPEHAGVNLPCMACHLDHKGRSYNAAAAASFGCVDGCHVDPHRSLIRDQPQLVVGFRPDAPGDVDFHLLHHIERSVSCVDCHGEATTSRRLGVRAACGQCHAPDGVGAGDCQQCHREHPDRDVVVDLEPTPPTPPPRFAWRGVLWAVGLIVAPFVFAAVLPRRRRVTIDAAAMASEGEDEDAG